MPKLKKKTVHKKTTKRPPTKRPPRSTLSKWDLTHDGITQSLLTKWIQCPERFRVLAVLGKIEDKPFNPKMEFGSMLHAGLETRANQFGDREAAVKDIIAYGKRLVAKHPNDVDEIRWWTQAAIGMFDRYHHRWNNDSQLQWIEVEQNFKINYKLPSGDSVLLRGKIDGVFKDSKGGIWLMEHKCKGSIDQDAMQRTLHKNLQNMFYLTVICQQMKGVKGILYDVIQRPFTTIRKTKTETLQDFMARGLQKVTSNPGDHFFRWQIPVTNKELKEFQTTSLNPILERLVQWWNWIAAEPDNPWREGNEVHWMRPFGMFDSFDWGNKGDYYDLITTGSTATLTDVDTLFPELET